jgi:hypothetical protein
MIIDRREMRTKIASILAILTSGMNDLSILNEPETVVVDIEIEVEDTAELYPDDGV